MRLLYRVTLSMVSDASKQKNEKIGEFFPSRGTTPHLIGNPMLLKKKNYYLYFAFQNLWNILVFTKLFTFWVVLHIFPFSFLEITAVILL